MDKNALQDSIPAKSPAGTSAQPIGRLHALSGIRFFAVFHIFLHHLWVLYDLDKNETYKDLLIGVGSLPPVLLNFLSNGWMSTSFFFLLSGFILAYLYWGENGQLVISKKRFWFLRFSRIYPIHILLMIITIAMLAGYRLEHGAPIGDMIVSALATLTLTQAWFPPAVPTWSWPTWALSALVFLHLVTPWLMSVLARLSRQQMMYLLLAMPVLSLAPTAVFALVYADGADPGQNARIFLDSTPLFWLPHFVAGMLLSRLFTISRFTTREPGAKRRWLSWGDLALVAVIVIACLPTIEEPLKHFMRHGLVMPLYMVVVVELARGNGLAARFFSLPGMGFLGETSFSIFIWQNLVMILCWTTAPISQTVAFHQLWVASLAIIVVAIVSTYLLEKPIARLLRRKFLAP